MNDKKQKLELTWIGKENRPRLEPRILLEDPEKSYRKTTLTPPKEGITPGISREENTTPSPSRDGNSTVTFPSLEGTALTPIPSLKGNKKGWVNSQEGIFDNRLIFGDNLLALNALEQELAGKIKCIFIDPPYNTGSAFEHYDDGIEHSLWLSLIRDRLDLLWRLLATNGSLWITIDDNECHYLKILCDEICGRRNFVTSIAWEKDKGRRSDTDISSAHDHILLYVREKESWRQTRNLLPRTTEQTSRYRNPDRDPRGPWLQGDNGSAKSGTEKQRFEVTLPSGRVVTPPPGRYWVFSKDSLAQAVSEGRAYFGSDGNRLPIIKRYLSEVQEGVVPRTFWPADEAGHNQEAKRDHLNKLLSGVQPFETPKPERLLHRILTIATNPGEWVLDSFAGSGTTGAVAHKMGRRWMMVELGEHCHTLIIPRMTKVIDGTDQNGVTEDSNWRGGGGFRYFRLAPSLLEKDKWGNWVISKEYNATMLASAMAKHEGFVYNPDETFYWKQGKSTEKDYIFTTTNFITVEYLDSIHEEMQTDESLLICCKSFQEACESRYENITVKKIPNMLLGRCEFGKEDYSLNITEVPLATDDAYEDVSTVETTSRKEKKKLGAKSQPGLFDEKEDNDDG